MKRIVFIILFFVVVHWVEAQHFKAKQTATDVDLIIFMGQSNMAGRGVVNNSHPEDAPAVTDGNGFEFRAFSDPTRLYPITKLFGITEDNPDGINDFQKKTGGMVPAFINACYSVTGRPVVAVSASEGGTRSSLWLPHSIRLDDAIERFLRTVQWLNSNGFIICRKVMVWAQGESDADNDVSSLEYKNNLRHIIDAMKVNGVEHCYIIQIGNYNGTNPQISYESIQKAQNDFCIENDDCTMVSHLFPSFKVKGLMKDAFHYYQDAYNIVGSDAGTNVGVMLKLY